MRSISTATVKYRCPLARGEVRINCLDCTHYAGVEVRINCLDCTHYAGVEVRMVDLGAPHYAGLEVNRENC